MIPSTQLAIERVQAQFPDRDVCQRCLMTFRRNKADVQAEGPLRCPDCARKFWCAYTSDGVTRCYTAGHTEAA